MNDTPAPNTPRALGYRMPAEWDPHAATWLSWPRHTGQSFRPRYDEVLPTFAEMVRTLAPHEIVNINVADAPMEEEVRQVLLTHEVPLDNVRFQRIPTNEPWCRDHGPTFVTSRNANRKPGTADSKSAIRNPSTLRSSATAEDGQSAIAIVDWDYNAYGKKYPRFDLDDAVPQRIARFLDVPLFRPGIVLEGGSIDVNGAGSVLTTEACLLHPNRNPQLTKSQIEQCLCDYLGVTNVLWLGIGIVGDDTDGHVDDFARFVDHSTVVLAVEEDPRDDNYAVSQDNLQRLRAMKNQDGKPLRVITLPMPGVIEQKGQRLPASYANFYIANGVVLFPTYRHPNDARAQEILRNLFPDRRVVPIDSTAVIWGGGSFHCLTQQQPAAA
jgi:agmatine deiminase